MFERVVRILYSPLKMIRKRQVLSGYIFAIGATAIWSGNFIIARGLSDAIPPVSLAFWRWVVAVIVFLPFASKSLVAERHILKRHIPYLCVTALLGITVFNTLIYFAGHTTSAINLSLISITFPVFIVILSRFVFGELITANKAIGIVLVVAGILFLISKGEFTQLFNISFAIGDLWMLLAAIIFAVYSILVKRKPEQLSIKALQLSTFILGLMFLFPFFVWEYVKVPPVDIKPSVIYSILYVGIFASLVAFVLWGMAIETIGPSKSGMVYYTLPLFSMVLSNLFLGEVVTAVHLFSASLIVSGIVIANYERNKSLVAVSPAATNNKKDYR
jgi:drug/metabolite transporter (DMT)-like permease